MTGDIWEQAVETYLVMDRGLFLSPQYLIGKPKVWEANPDFLAVVFPDRQVWMVEVSKRPGSKILNKIKEFRKEYANRIREQLEQHQVITGEAWEVDLWLFLPETETEKYQKLTTAACGPRSKVTALEDTLKTTAWSARFR